MRLNLVFWGFRVLGYIMVYFLTVIMLKMIKVIYHLIETISVLLIFSQIKLTRFDYIDSGS